MNCHEFWKTPPGTAQQCERERHLAECPACTAQVARFGSLAGAMRVMAANSRGIGAPARVEARLLAAFRSHNGLSAVRERPVWSGVASWAAPAAAMIAMAVLLVSGHEPQAPRRHAQNVMELAVLQDAAVLDENTLLEDRTAGFIPLPNAPTLVANEEVNLVRVEVPRSAMMAVGLTVSEERALERVQADVMLGTDGLPRAVRFLDE